MLITPIRQRTVSFQLPGSTERAATAPPRIRRQEQQQAPPTFTGSHTHTPALSSSMRTKPLIAGPNADPKPVVTTTILERPKTAPRPCKVTGILDNSRTNTLVNNPTQVTEEPPRNSVDEATLTKELVPDPESAKLDQKSSKMKPERRVLSEQAKVSKAKLIRNHRGGSITRHVHSPGARITQSSQVAKIAHTLREQTNVATFDHIRWMKHDVAKLREHLVKMEDEIKLANKGKALLDARIFDLRKCLSVNQQSISAQQKKTHKREEVL